MVWHTHMLNPRAFLEDCMRHRITTFWNNGIPWALIDKAIDNNTFTYNVSDACKRFWSRKTNRAWENEDDPMEKTLRCPNLKCFKMINIPWTTCQLPTSYVDDESTPIDFDGTGYGEDLNFSCQHCGAPINTDILTFFRFNVDRVLAIIEPAGSPIDLKDNSADSLLITRDMMLLGIPKTTESRPMPGTLLHPKTGTPVLDTSLDDYWDVSFPSRFLVFTWQLTDKLYGVTPTSWPTMNSVRDVLNGQVKDRKTIEKAQEKIPSSLRPTYHWRAVRPMARIALRKMMARYFQNHSMFALDLRSAIMRQGIFIQKMCQLDWLHSPMARDTMNRAIERYHRFFAIINRYPGKLVVPTLDIDLVWHTHQLSPGEYYDFSIKHANYVFIDHDDKVESSTLNTQFEWTCKTYQSLYGEVYSQCTCWYCEGEFSPVSYDHAIGENLT